MRAVIVVLLSLAACMASTTTSSPPSRPPPTPPTDPTQSPMNTGGEEGAACMKQDDCASMVCEGQGCGADTPGSCAPSSRGCTRDRRQYCGCDGVTFEASGSCPGKRFASRGACPAS